MSVELMDALFADRKTSIQTLGVNFERLANSMDRLLKSKVFAQGKLRRVAELGGGAGILGMWLVANGLCESCEIFDRAQKPLAIGREWAASLSLDAVTFHHICYAEIASSKHQNFDFVFAEHAVDLGYVPKSLDSVFVASNESGSTFSARYNELAGALKHMLLPTGIGLIGSGSPTPASLSLLCVALRERQLTIDWKFSSNEDGLQLFVRPLGHVVLNAPEDESLAILADVLPARKTSPSEALSLEKIFQQGIKYVEVCSESIGVNYKCSIFQFAGLACLLQKQSRAYESARVVSAARMHALANDVLRDARTRNITSIFIDDRLRPLVDAA